ncbi:Ig-like domain-containing protein [Paenibacillus sp. J22TS3]|uniref:Ig-like domain-containing protein n=1 Tax=Paenibacillus sp. J22TS3 TaxID=2807192 RepID=UPI001B2B07AE|nr:Ig-like domain-containing protein [Paenibacillus sp. J22TS3]GIP24156.1 hypothetical protein J22TS3_44310 [Paenibacillus sp. J22TS3]
MNLVRGAVGKWKVKTAAGLVALSLSLPWNATHTYAASSDEPSIAWTVQQTTEGTPREAVHTQDGGYAMLQVTKTGYNLTKTNDQGTILWSRSITPELPPVQNFERYLSSEAYLQETPDGRLVIFGANDWYKITEFFTVTTNSDGSSPSTKILSSNRYGKLTSAKVTPDGGYILTADVERNMKQVIAVKKFNSYGELFWEKYIFYNQLGNIHQLQVTDDGYLLSGYSKGDFNELRNWTLTKLGPSGEELWNRSNPELFPPHSRTIEGPDHNLINVRVQGDTLQAAKISPDLQVVWTKDILDGKEITVEDVQFSANGQLLIGGNIQTDLNVSDEYVAQLGGDGSLGWFKYIGEASTEEKLKQVLPLENGDLSTYGAKNQSGYLVKLSRQGNPDPQDQLSLDSSEYSLIPGDSLDVRLALSIPGGNSEDVTSKSTYKVEDPRIATVDAAGNITGVAPGKTKLTATYQGLTVSSTVVVYRTVVQDLQLDSKEYSLLPGQTLDVHLTVKESGTIKEITSKGTFRTDNTKVAVVDSEGNLTAVGHGETVLTATYQGAKVQAKVTVY